MDRFFVFSTTDLILTGVTAALFIIQLLYYLVTYLRPYRHMSKNTSRAENANATPSVSVIVYTKNESENLKKHLPSLLSQDYPNYEVIVINDGSTDQSEDVLKGFELEYKNLYHTFTPENSKYLSRKKLALTIGIKAAKNEILLFTEANCFPASNNWISSMVRNYTKETKIVLGFCAYKFNYGFFHKLVSYDNLIAGLQYITSALAQHPFTANGKNLSYRKELFFQQKGYQKSLSLHAGDDDLFINNLADKTNTIVEYSPESITEFGEAQRYKTWEEMKVSRAATQKYFKGWSLTFFRLESISFILFLICLISSIIYGIVGNPATAITAGLLYISLSTAKAIVINKSAKMLQQKPNIALLPILEIARPLFNLYIRIYRSFKGKHDYTFSMEQ